MPIGSWIVWAILLATIITICGFFGFIIRDGDGFGLIMGGMIGVVISVIILVGMLWYYGNTASGQRELIDERSNLSNGIHRIVTVYTANGEIIAQYEGKIDIEANDGGYIKFDFEGKRYIYYNCFVESIAIIN